MYSRFSLLLLVLAAPLALAAQSPEALLQSQFAGGGPYAFVFDGGDQQPMTQIAPMVMYTSDGWFGAGLTDLNDQSFKDLKLKSLNGVEVTSVDATGAAGHAGLKPNDVIVSFNGQNVFGVREIQRLFTETPGGRTVPIEIVRDGKTQTVSVTLDARPAPMAKVAANMNVLAGTANANALLAQAAARMDSDPNSVAALKSMADDLRKAQKEFDDASTKFGPNNPSSITARNQYNEAVTQLRQALAAMQRATLSANAPKAMNLRGGLMRVTTSSSAYGVTTETVSDQLGAYFGLKDGQHGALVTDVKADSPAAKAGLKAGDVVVNANGKPFGPGAANEFSDLSHTHAGENLELDVLRKGAETKVTLPASGPSQ